MSRLYCIDASIYIFRAYFSMPDRWYNDAGYPLNAVYGYARFLVNFIRETRPSYLMAAYDESLGSGYRHTLYPDYKSNRVLPDESLAFQLAACRELGERLGIRSYAGARFEADDYIASGARIAAAAGLPVTVVSRDKDLVQAVRGEHDEWWDYAAGTRLSKAEWEASQQLRVEQIADWLALMGDSIDAIPGVPGIGKKTAIALLSRFESLDGIYAQLDNIHDSGIRGAARIRQALLEHREQVYLARKLTVLHDRAIKARSAKPFSFSQRGERLQDYLLEIGCGAAWSRKLLADLERA
ncbi:5'-3' exonuclease H3TH domain-containing protein [Litorivivens sp.]|uniref:5'-3' exonuclease n=1 Tax=Litorivivens sp. TaxID=2020868 RepID=UPI003567BEC4